MTSRPDLFLLNVAVDTHGIHGHVFIDVGNVCEPTHGATRDGWEPVLEETRWLIALIRPDTPEERG